MTVPRALYFGCMDHAGHYLHDQRGCVIWDRPDGCPWDMPLMDGGLLRNGGRKDVVDGRVFWTCGGPSINDIWLAFYWWDRSVDKRGACNSGFYVHGFKHTEPDAAFAFACHQFPKVVERQQFPLVIQHP